MKTPAIITLIHGTLIHGTFAKKADWSSETSSFRKSILDGLDADIHFERFAWSGRNNLDDRHRAADELAKFLIVQRSKHPTAKQIVIGHSYGGSILAYLHTRHPAVASTLLGAGFLATPFLDARPRREWALVATLTVFAFSVLLMALIAGAFFYALIAADSQHRTLGWGTQAMLGFPLMVILFLAVRFTRPARFERYDATRLAKALSTCHLPDGQYLFLRVTGDEAASALSAAQFSSWIFSKLINWTARPWAFVARKPSASQLVVFSSLILGQWAGFVVAKSFFEPSFLASTFSKVSGISGVILIGLVVFTVAFAFSLVWISSFVACWVCHRSFGRASFLAAMFIELVVEPIPIGSHTLVHTAWANTEVGWSHSSPYKDPDAIAAIRDWMRTIVQF